MILQVLSDCTINGPFGFRMYGPGELVTLPTHHAVQIVNLEPEHFKILKPTPLILGVAVRWLLPDDSPRGPAIVQLVDGTAPDRTVAVQIDGSLYWVPERDIVEIDPWPAIDARLEGALDQAICEGEDSPKVNEIREWLWTHFDDDVSDR